MQKGTLVASHYDMWTYRLNIRLRCGGEIAVYGREGRLLDLCLDLQTRREEGNDDLVDLRGFKSLAAIRPSDVLLLGDVDPIIAPKRPIWALQLD